MIIVNKGQEFFIIERPIYPITTAVFIRNGHNRYYNLLWKFSEPSVLSKLHTLHMFMTIASS